MSTATDIAELEATIAEAELSDEEAELAKSVHAEGLPVEEAIAAVLAERAGASANGNGAAHPEPESGEPSTKQLESFEKELIRHEKRVHEIMGGHVAGFVACDKCGGVGLTAPGPSPQPHEWFKACPTCEGFGLVLTGSIRPGSESRDCPACKGRGYLERIGPGGASLAESAGSAAAPALAPPAPPVEPAATIAAGGESGETWGTPSWMGDPTLGS